jgi:hypothetical protein
MKISHLRKSNYMNLVHVQCYCLLAVPTNPVPSVLLVGISNQFNFRALIFWETVKVSMGFEN